LGGSSGNSGFMISQSSSDTSSLLMPMSVTSTHQQVLQGSLSTTLVRLAPQEFPIEAAIFGSRHEGTVISSIHSVRDCRAKDIRDYYWLAEDPYSASTPEKLVKNRDKPRSERTSEA